MSSLLNVMPERFGVSSPETLDQGLGLREIELAASTLIGDSESHRYCAVNLRQMNRRHWLELLDDARFPDLTMPVLCLADEPSLHDWNADPAVTRHQFYVQLLERYHLAHLTSYHTLGRELPKVFGENADSERLARDAVALRQALSRSLHTTMHAVSLTFGCEGKDLTDLFVTLFDLPRKHKLSWLGEPLPAPGEPIARDTLQDFLDNLAHCYHIGRYRRAEADASTRLLWPSTQTTSQKMFVEFRRAWREWAGRSKYAPHRVDREPAAVFARMRLYFLFRDIARSLVNGGVDLHRNSERRVRLIVLDDNPDEIKKHLENLRKIMWQDEVTVDFAPSSAWSDFSTWFQRSWLDPTLTRAIPDKDVASRDTASGTSRPQEEFEDVFLVDVDFEGRDRGPELVSWIRSWGDTPPQSEQLRALLPPREKGKRWSPRIMILTNARASESIQLSMNLGVETYVFKDRIYSLPAWLSQIPEFGKLKSVRDSSADFRSIHKMPIRMLARLNSRKDSECITGDPAMVWERQWLERLPKADLHFHIGTSISSSTTLTLATNTFWYTREVFRYQNRDDRMLCQLFRDVWTLFAKAGLKRRAGKLVEWRVAIEEALDEAHGKAARPPYERMLEIWQDKNQRLAPHDLLSVVVTAIGHLEYRQKGADLRADPTVVALDRLRKLTGEGASHPSPQIQEAAFRLWDRILDATRADRWQGTFSRRPFESTLTAIARHDGGAVTLADKLARRCSDVREFVSGLYDDWESTLPDELRDETDGKPAVDVSLAQLVEVPDIHDGSLARYLEGAALLGAEHLQYPENIVLAALDIVDQNVRDNVLYSEIRCAPTGYCLAGLEPLAATDILCQAFDAAEVLYGTLYGRWAMTNVLLGAKRHKGPKDVKAVVELITRYLQYPYGLSAAGEVPGMPRWWRRTRVIGFDLSGREDIKADDFHEALQPLFEYCAAITVHAGEAASAEKIWEAVYKLGARRIGHGLKLRDHRRLLEYCLTEGICLELCPISNRYTNGFTEEKPDEDGEAGGRSERHPDEEPSPYRYPLGYYLKEGLRVAISTDNRFLHTKHCLSDEFLAGARMVNGLTRLDVLRIVKNGFYNAFLNKADLGMLLDAVDNMVFRSLAEEDERIHGPETA